MARNQTRRSHAAPVPRGVFLAVAFLAVAFTLAGCNLDTPTGPNSGLTGTNPSQDFTFNGTITLTRSTTVLPADDVSTGTVTAEVRDVNGAPVQNLTPVTFSIDLGQLVLDDGSGASAAQVTTLNGRASIRFSSLNRAFGTATIQATVGDRTQSIQVELEVVPIEGSVTLTFGGTGTTINGATVTPTVPHREPLLAVASDGEGDLLAGVKLRFRISEDDSTGSGRGPARFEGFAETFTNTEGEATNQLVVKGAGRVVVEVDLIDPNTGEIVATSNQVILVTIEAPEDLVITLSIESDDTVQASGTAPFTAVLIAKVTRAGDPVGAATVRFEVSNATGGSVTLANGSTTEEVVTDGTGRAISSATAATAGTNGTIIVRLLDGPGGSVIATSNAVLISGS